MRMWLVLWLVGLAACHPAESAEVRSDSLTPQAAPHLAGRLEDRMVVFQFEGGQIVLELYRLGNRIEQVARNRYAVPIVLHWSLDSLDNLEAMSPIEGVVLLPPAPQPLATSEPVVLAALLQTDPSQPYRRTISFNARFGDPRARPTPYNYGLPYRRGQSFVVLQGFHGAFSHRGSDEYAVDFNCPVATQVIAARPGIVVAANASAQGAGTTSEFLDEGRANFVIVQHDDGTLAEYKHLSPSGVIVEPGQAVERGQPLALSGNTGYSTTPHLHFMVMTAADDGINKRSFPFVFEVAPNHASAPVQGRRYTAWE